MTIHALIMIVAAYLIGSISFAVVVSKLMGLADPHSYGSGNPGATNVLRSGSKTAAALTLLGDAVKGWLAVFVALLLKYPDMVIAAVAIAVMLGHFFPIFFKFKGGKGVATALGVLTALSWQVSLTCLGVWLVIAFGLKISSLAALVAAIIAPFAAWYFMENKWYALLVAVIALMVLVRHKANIQRLLNKQESKIGKGE
ncbi:MAG: glycerol-3-phosphate 1-O-acyltransferase PlsY [Neisseriaceae bacterium]|nr:glycerol-3-phosphate 1-O-acyltransferase PlsY [Neisseriaceae bacterium]